MPKIGMKCIACGSGATYETFKLYDDRYGFPGLFDSMRCRECGHIFLGHDFMPEEITELYSDYYPRSSFDLESYRPHKEEFGFSAWLNGARRSAFRWVPENVRVLDIGCGFGETLGYHAARGCDVYGVEADKNIRRVAAKFGFRVHVGLFDPDQYNTDYFDYITMDQVLEHVTSPAEILRGIACILKPGGIAVISFPNTEGWGAWVFGLRWINWHAPYHLQFYTKSSMRILADQAGLEIIANHTITPSTWLYYQWMHLLTYPKMGQPSKFWAGTALGKQVGFTAVQRTSMRLLNLVHRAKINHLITRVFDAMELGDNRLVFLRKP